jgi:hypothetical protein
VIFLLILISPQYNGAAWIYHKILKNIFNKYESNIYNLGLKVANTITVAKNHVEKEVEKNKKIF